MDLSIGAVAPAMVYTSDIGASARRSGILSGRLQVVGSGACIETAFMEQAVQPWQRRELAFRARILAVHHRSPSTKVFAGLAAAAVAGFDMYPAPLDVEVWTPYRPSRPPAPLPALEWPDDPKPFVVPQARVVGCMHRRHPGLLPAAPREQPRVVSGAGLWMLHPFDNAVWTAGHHGPEVAFQVVGQTLRVASDFDRDDPVGSRRRESSSREHLLDTALGSPRWCPHPDQMLWVLRHADAGCESVGEARMVFGLRAVGVRGIATQFKVVTNAGPRFADIGIEHSQVLGEYEGWAKDGDTADLRRQARTARDRRDKDLAPRGWRVIHVNSDDLADIPQLVADFQSYATRPLHIDPTAGLPGPLPWGLAPDQLPLLSEGGGAEIWTPAC